MSKELTLPDNITPQHPAVDDTQKQIDNVVLYFLAILYSVVFVICTLRLAPYLLVGRKEESEVRKKLTFD